MRGTKLAAMLAAAMMLLSGTCAGARAEGMVTIALDGQDAGSESGAWQRDEKGIFIRRPGEYLLTGKLAEGQILVDCLEDGKVTLYLNGVEVHHETGPAIRIEECSPRAVISLVEGSENVLSDGTALVLDENEEPDGVVFSRSDLSLEGNGRLKITAGAQNGIVSKDDLKILGGKLEITAPNHGIKGKDCVEISGGSISIRAGRDGIKSTNKKDPDRGYIDISGGEITIFCGDDPLSFITSCRMAGGRVNLTMTE